MTKTKLSKHSKKKLNVSKNCKKQLHEMAIFGMLTIKVLGLNDKHGLLECSMNIMHKASHAIKDVLDGIDPEQAIKENLAKVDEEEE